MKYGVWIEINGRKIFCEEGVGIEAILIQNGISLKLFGEAMKKRNEAERKQQEQGK